MTLFLLLQLDDDYNDDMNAGNIPHELSQSSLQRLELDNNKLSGESYDAISDAAAATDDDINAGRIPHQLSNSKVLQLSNNNLSGES